MDCDKCNNVTRHGDKWFCLICNKEFEPVRSLELALKKDHTPIKPKGSKVQGAGTG